MTLRDAETVLPLFSRLEGRIIDDVDGRFIIDKAFIIPFNDGDLSQPFMNDFLRGEDAIRRHATQNDLVVALLITRIDTHSQITIHAELLFLEHVVH